MPKAIMTIVGFGPMGRRFTRLFADDLDVQVSSSRDVQQEVEELGGRLASDRQSAMAESDYIFLAVPLTALPSLIYEVNENAKPDAVVVDCCSARVPAEEALRELVPRHFGMHDVKNGEYCITGDIDERMVDFLRRHDIAVRQIAPEEHDRINATIGLGHFIGLSLGRFLTDEQKGILSAIGSGSKLMSLVSGLASNTSTTWRETQIDNQFTEEARASLLDALAEYHGALSQGTYPFDEGSEQMHPEATSKPARSAASEASDA
jgi:prephenate dehydrogenase